MALLKQSNVIETDVSRLVEKVRRENLLFYPLMIHVLANVMKKMPQFKNNNLFAVYQVPQENGQPLLVWQEVKESWSDFFADYAVLCYESLASGKDFSKGLPPVGSFGVFYLENNHVPTLNTDYPSFGLHPFKYEKDKIILPIAILGQDDDAFIKEFSHGLNEMICLF